jgi:esterase/lipase superfamily enzyme
MLMANNFHFHAEAYALTGQLKLPFQEEIKKQAFVKLEGALANLPVEERARRNYFSQHAKNFRLEGVISYAAAHTQVSGHESLKHDGASVTLATSVVKDLNILNIVTADRVVAQISTTHFPGEYCPHVTFLGTHFDNLRIARHRAEPYLKLNLAGPRAEGKDAMPVNKGTGLMNAVEAQYQRMKEKIGGLRDKEREKMRLRDTDASLGRKYCGFSVDCAKIQQQASAARENDGEWDGITCSLVEHVEITDIGVKAADGRSIQIPPPAQSFGHVIHIPDFGNIFLGELTVKHNSYNLTMIRLDMGCLAKGSVSIATCCVNGRSAGGGGNGGPDDLGDARKVDFTEIETASTTSSSPTDLAETTQQENPLFRVWYGTNRAFKNVRDPGKGFKSEFDPDRAVHYGYCTVYIPKSHKFGSTGTSWWDRWRKLKFEDDHLKIVECKTSASAGQFFSEIRQEIAALGPLDRQILLYLHGYCVSFDEAAVRAAQIGFDLKAVGVTAFFSWPSCGSVRGYFADADRVAASEPAITEFLHALTRDTGAQAVHIIAHSMGNRGLARSIQRIVSDTSMSGVRFGQIILAAPDIEVSLFRDLAAVYPKVSNRTTMYVSARDRALQMSKFLQHSDRAGFTPPITVVPNIDTVEVTDIDLTVLGHGYYSEAEPVLYDMNDVLRHNSPPGSRQRIRRAGGSGQPLYWVIGK